MHVLMSLMKLMCIAVEILMMLLVKTVKVEHWNIKAIESAVETECRASWEVSTFSAVEEKCTIVIKEAIGMEEVMKVWSLSCVAK